MALPYGECDGDASGLSSPLGPGTLSPFLVLLHSVSAKLSESEVREMVFLCRDKVAKRQREAVRSGMDLFSILMEQLHIDPDNLQFLRKLLENLPRADLRAEVQRFEEERELDAPGDRPDEHEQRLLRVATTVICDRVGREWKKLMRELGMPEVKLDRIEAAHRFNLYEQLVQGLREWQKWKGKDAKVADLIKALRGCQLNLVADLVEGEISKVSAGTR